MLNVNGQNFNLYVIKRRFICHKCNNKFTEELNLNASKCNISNKLKIEIRKLLLNPNLNIKTIANLCNVSSGTVRNELLETMKTYPKALKTMTSVISFDEFKADTKSGKYAFIINDPIHKKTLDILPSREKE